MKLTQFIEDTNVIIDDLDIIYHEPTCENGSAAVQVIAIANGKAYSCVMNAKEEVRKDIAAILDNELATMKNLGVEDHGIFNELTGDYLASRILRRFPDMTHCELVSPNKKEFTGRETVGLINLALNKIICDIYVDAAKSIVVSDEVGDTNG